MSNAQVDTIAAVILRKLGHMLVGDVSCKPNSGIVVVRYTDGRVFKIEITQVHDGANSNT